MRKMIVSDFDNTLYHKGVIDKKDIEKIKHFRLEGNIFVIATGSSYTSFKRKIEGFNLEYDYLIVNHGTGVYKEDKLIYDEKLDEDILLELINRYDLSKKENYTVIKNTRGNFFSTSKKGLVSPDEKDIAKVHIEFDKDNYEKEVSYLKNKYKDRLNIYEILSNYDIELISSKTSKLKMIEDIIEKEKIDVKNVYTIGDGNSDYEMIKKYNGYAVENAIKRVKKVAVKTVLSVGELIDDALKEKL